MADTKITFREYDENGEEILGNPTRFRDLEIVADSMETACHSSQLVQYHLQWNQPAHVVLFVDGSVYTIHTMQEWHEIVTHG